MSAVDTVTAYLRLVEERRLAEAAGHLSTRVEIVFPGGRRFANLDEQVTASKARYRSISKTFDRFDVLTDGDSEIVYVFGTLEGEDLDGQRFDSVRFIDRFELVDGLIIAHDVWNDLAEDRAGGSQGGSDE